MPENTLDARLSSVAEFVRQGARFADIGTDHALLPLFLLRTGRITYAYATDVNQGPLERARLAVSEAGLSGSVELRLCDGLSGMEGLGLTDIAVCGMGGELIARILDGAPLLRDAATRWILQPMTKARHLRLYLASAGFSIEGERFSLVGKRAYTVIVAHYTGHPFALDDAEAEIGRARDWTNPGSAAHKAYLAQRVASLRKEEEGFRHRGDGAEASRLAEVCRLCEQYLK